MMWRVLAVVGAGLYLVTRSEDTGQGSDLPRGIRNNNPGNLENNGIAWQGLADDQSADPRFYVFKDAGDGIRALARVLLTYRNRHGIDTVEGIISRWAPSFENDTWSYQQAVANAVGVDPSASVPDDDNHLAAMVGAIIHHENGMNPYPDSLIRASITRARA